MLWLCHIKNITLGQFLPQKGFYFSAQLFVERLVVKRHEVEQQYVEKYFVEFMFGTNASISVHTMIKLYDQNEISYFISIT